MRLTKYYVNTLREAPADAEIVSHMLMMRAGMIRKLAAGVYTYMPVGLRVIRKIENIVRQCMNDAGAIELLMPSVQPAELWEESGRWQQYGKELLRMKDRHNREFCYGPTHEEVITDVVRGTVKSYKQLPLNLYQIQTKFRDEVRPRFGLMRGREFIMKDAYSFDVSDEMAQVSYELMRQAYCKIFEKCGLKYKMVEADSGAIGGSYSHEFMVLAQTGEDAVISCDNCNYAANMEKATAVKPITIPYKSDATPKDIDTPNAHTVEEVSTMLNVPTTAIIKTIVVCIDESKFALILVRGDYEANLIKLKNHLGASTVEMATPEEIFKQTNAPVGFIGPQGSKLPIYADYSVEDMDGAVVGGNKKDVHTLGIKIGRDFTPLLYGDFRNAIIGDSCPHCKYGKYEITRGIEVGHIFKLGTKYSESMNAKYLDDNGKQQLIVMGCYGIGIGRISAASVEQNSDDKGICWPIPIAPFEVVVIPLNTNEPDVVNLGETVYKELLKMGVDVAIDDRNDRAGSKLADADLIGYPIRINVGKKYIADGMVELVTRFDNQTRLVKKEDVVSEVMDIINTHK